ncbi:MAG: flagellar hook-associated protein FlgL [Butyrivibrio sp.]|nr:flagellar hook-associated protein FlgL [Muribaculum sp.]MCM1551354.1 flagellar hook-associated protein FlgL [Butyrivibrio sp.]
MRITNKIMQRNNLSNINTNKIYQDKLSTQMSTQKKVSRPSDDPVVAIRALRLRSSVTEITQYYSKNIPDAESWLEVTEDALKNLEQIMRNMIEQCTKGSNGELEIKDRQIILEQLKALSDEVYSTGDADYAGRYVFTGYRTDLSLSFPEATTKEYTITEQLDRESISSLTKVETGDLLNWTEANFNKTSAQGGVKDNTDEQKIDAYEVYRIRLAYNDCSKGMAPTLTRMDTAGNEVPITYEDPDNPGTDITVTTTVMSSANDPYKAIHEDANKNKVIFVPETGELLLGQNVYDAMMKIRDDPTTVKDEGEIRITYQKENWAKGDLRPEHYFYCKSVTDAEGELEYNKAFLDGTAEKQAIEYDVGFNQTIRVNSTADECFKPGIGREADDLVSAMEQVMELEKIQAKMECLKETASGEDAKTLQTQLDAMGKALTYAKDRCQKLFEHGITTFQNYLDGANLCITNCGTRSKKLELIENRMQSQKTTFETLKSENEDVDITEVAIQLNSAELTYEAALMATGKVMQSTLLNFI